MSNQLGHFVKLIVWSTSKTWTSTMLKYQKISKTIYGVLNFPKKPNEKSLSWVFPKENMLRIMIFCLFCGKIEDFIICFRDSLTFSKSKYLLRFEKKLCMYLIVSWIWNTFLPKTEEWKTWNMRNPTFYFASKWVKNVPTASKNSYLILKTWFVVQER